MRACLSFAFLAALTWGVAGCGDSSSTPPPAESHLAPGSANVPGAPTEGPEAPRTKAPKRH